MELLERASVESILRRLKPSPFSSWSCTPEVEKRLQQLNPGTIVNVWGTCQFRLADDHPSYYIEQIIVQ